MRKSHLFLLILLLSSCNVLKTINGVETKVDEDFFQNSSNQSFDLDDSLFGFWRFEEALSGNASLFSQINSREITDAETMGGGVGRISGSHNQALDCFSATGLGGTNQMLKTVDTFSKSALSSFSLSVWIQKGGTCSTTNEPVFSTKGLEVNIFSPGSCNSATYDFVEVRSREDAVNNSDALNYGTSMFSTSSSWHHLVINFTRESSTWDYDIYFDNSFLNSGSVTNYNEGNSYITLCERYNGYSHGVDPTLGRFRGNIDSFGLWSRKLSVGEIDKLYSGNNNLDQ